MKTIFGEEHLEALTPKFIIQLGGYLFEKDIHQINVRSVKIEPGANDLMQRTSIHFKDYNNHDYNLLVHHAKDMSCSNWDFKK